MRIVREVIEENIDYAGLILIHPTRAEEIEGYVDLMVQACCSDKPTIRINCEDYPQAVVRSRFEKLTFRHIDYVLDCMENNTTKIRNIRAYTLSALFNSYSTIDSYYGAEVSHDFAKAQKGAWQCIKLKKDLTFEKYVLLCKKLGGRGVFSRLP